LTTLLQLLPDIIYSVTITTQFTVQEFSCSVSSVLQAFLFSCLIIQCFLHLSYRHYKYHHHQSHPQFIQLPATVVLLLLALKEFCSRASTAEESVLTGGPSEGSGGGASDGGPALMIAPDIFLDDYS
jgi:hypothetical protein